MTEPIRWIDDPAFKMRTGIRIEDDDALLDGYDLDAMAARLGEALKSADVSGSEASASSTAASTSALSTKGVIALVTTTALVSATLGVLVPSMIDDGGADAPSTIAPEIDVAPTVAFKQTLKVAPSREEHAPAVATSPRAEVAPTTTTSSALVEEIALYERGARALERGDTRGAVGLLRQYRERYPDGQLRSEARLSEFEGLVRLGDDDAAIECALTIVADSSMRARWDDVMKTLSGLARRADRCDEVHARLKLRKVSKRALTRFLKGCD